MINSLRYTVRQAFTQFFRNRAMSIASIFAITTMLLILGLFLTFMINVNMAAESAKKEFDTVQIYLLDFVTNEEAQEIMEEVDEIEGVSSTTYLSKEEALEKWKVKWGENADLLDSMGENPLPNSIIVKVETLEASGKVVKEIKKIAGIEGVKYYKDTVKKLMDVTEAIKITALCIIIFMVVVSVIIVSNTIKLTVLARSSEIYIMKYVGATNWFVRGPFFVEGIIIGLISAIISVSLVTLAYTQVVEFIGEEWFLIFNNPLVPSDFIMKNLICIFSSLGIGIGACGSIISMRKFLDA